MKPLLASLVSLHLALPAFALAPGDEVSLDSIRKAEFLTGAAPAEWAKDQLYLLDCWATTCGPCLATMPHLDALYDRYHPKGLNVLGMNVQEDDRDAVERFVARRGKGISYPIAFVGKGGEFEKSWLQASGSIGIPQVFLVKNGRLLVITRPDRVDEGAIEDLLAGGERERAAVARIRDAEARDTEILDQFDLFIEAGGTGDTEAMAAAVARLEELAPDRRELLPMKTEVAARTGRWEETARLFGMLASEGRALGTAMTLARVTDALPDAPPAVLLEPLARTLSSATIPDPMITASHARILWKLGQREEAIATAKKFAADPGTLPKAPAEAFAASFKGGLPQSLAELKDAIATAQEAE